MDIQKILEEVPDLAQLSPAELLKYFPYKAEIAEQVYDTLNCVLIPECRLPWVEGIFVPGHRYYETYCDMLTAYDRLLVRLGEVNDDEDVEVIINSLLEHGRIAAMNMFEYGRTYEKMQNQM